MGKNFLGGSIAYAVIRPIGVKTVQELLDAPVGTPRWLCDPFVTREGLTFLHGKTSIGKSPFTWELARCVSTGQPFFGWPTQQARVLYVEADTAEPLMAERLRPLAKPYGDWRILNVSGRSLDLFKPENVLWSELRAAQPWKPELVIWNTLRQFHHTSGNDAEGVARVYASMYKAFPRAGHFVVAHDRKESKLHEESPASEAFSGSAAWRDLATIGLHLTLKKLDPGKGTHVRLKHTKSQVSELIEPLELILLPDGTNWSLRDDQDAKILEAWDKAPADGDRAAWVAAHLGISRRSVFRARKRAENG